MIDAFTFSQHAELFVLGHSPNIVREVPELPYLTPLNINKAGVKNYAQIFLADLKIIKDYVGFITYLWDRKFPDVYRLDQLWRLQTKLQPDCLWCPVQTHVGWTVPIRLEAANELRQIEEVSRIHQLALDKAGVWGDFICHISIYDRFKLFFKEVYDQFPEESNFFYEQLVTLFFSNQQGLKIQKIPARLETPKLFI